MNYLKANFVLLASILNFHRSLGILRAKVFRKQLHVIGMALV